MTSDWLFDLRGDWEKASGLEWLEANGLGGYASSTACGANTRRYHGVLVAATNPPVGRIVLLSKLDERIAVGDSWFDLASNQFPGAIHPRGFENLDRFSRDLFPVFEYSAGGVRMKKTIGAIQGENTTVIIYELLESSLGEKLTIELRPFVAARDHHGRARADERMARHGTFHDGVFSFRPYPGTPQLFIAVPAADFDSTPDWYFNFEYPVEIERGLDAHEDLFTPGVFRRALAVRERVGIVISTLDPRGRDAEQLLEDERSRRLSLVGRAGTPMCRALQVAADQFVVQRGADRRSVIAGYPWFSDWGRDTMIALPGLCLVTGRFDDARRILLAFIESVSEGMLPNRFPDDGDIPEYNTVDATLWLFVVAHEYLKYAGDDAFVRDRLFPVMKEVVLWHRRGTRHGIHQDGDGLLMAGEPGVQLTWMDAKVGDHVVTPRQGKPVEIQALWFNALRILAGLERRWGAGASADELMGETERIRRRFIELFWDSGAGYLADVVDGDSRDFSLRPNQLFAISLPFPLLEGDAAVRVLGAIEKKLLTPFGLRTLSPDHPDYKPRCTGSIWDRDTAYHQGTVWPWLFGPYVDALIKVRGERGRQQGRRIVSALESHLFEAGVGTISEIFDGDDPHHSRGCIAQAWSVAEILRVIIQHLDTPPRE